MSDQQRPRRRRGIGLRLLAAQSIVLAAGVLTTMAVAVLVGPPLFREHLHHAGVQPNSLEQAHAEEAYSHATVLSIGGALAVSVLAAMGVSWYMSRRLQRTVAQFAAASTAITDGEYAVRVQSPRLGDDFDQLAATFNEMASRLQTVEGTRRRLFADLAHEIRTPVAVLEAYVAAIEDGVRTLTPDTAATLRDQTARLVRFSEDLNALTKAEESSVSMTHQSVDIEQLLRRCVDAARERFEAKGVALSTTIARGLTPLWADEQRLAQVVGNLLDNALRHTPAGGHVTLNCRSTSHDVIIEVADDGAGISPEHLPHLFERFYRADAARDRQHGGAGIGLAIVRAIVDAHGGTVTAASAGPGHGSRFTVSLPA